jgi:class 3 adenylate cyclase/CHASE2 domain-containing sensor protein
MSAKAPSKKSKPKQSVLSRLGIALLIAGISAILAWTLSFLPFTSRAELMSLDLRYQTRKPIELYPNLGYVNLDNDSCELAGPWPWPRSNHVALIKSLSFYGARAAGYDVFYVEPSPLEQGPAPIIDGLDEDELAEALGKMFLNHDKSFEEALLETKNIYLGEFFTTPEQLGLKKDVTEDVIKSELENYKRNTSELRLDAMAVAKTQAFKTQAPWVKKLDRALDLFSPIVPLAKASAGIGFEQIIPDNITGTVYEYPMFIEYDDYVYPALGLLIAADVLGIDLSKVEANDESFTFFVTQTHGTIKEGPLTVPVNAKMRSLMNWSAPYFETYFHINYRQLSRYYAANEIKEKLREKFEDSTDLALLFEKTVQWADHEHWVEHEECVTMVRNYLGALLVQQSLSATPELNRAALCSMLKERLPTLGAVPDAVVDSVRLSLHLLAHGTEADKAQIAANISSSEDPVLREGLVDLAQYPALEAHHATEIARNVLYFSHENRLEEVSPLYFPPGETSHVNGKLQRISPTMLKDKIFMIGLEGEGTIDLNPQPYEESCAMVALHVNAINSFLTGQFLEFPKLSETWLALCLLSLLVALVSQFISTRWSFPILLLTLGIFVYYVWQQFSGAGRHVQFVVPALGLLLSYFTSVGLQLYLAYREKQKMKGMFGKMVSPDVLKVMSENPDLFSLTGRRQPCTSTFSSMENFKEIIKGVTPQEMTGLLSSYLTPASQIITSYKGYIDKYEGHIIMSDFGVPLVTGDHRQQCLYASIEQQLDITAFKHHIYARTGKHVNTSIGVNTGFVSAGNMGSDKKMQYTIMGDTVNTAARFRPANWIYNYLGGIIIGETTYPFVKDIVQTRPLDRLLLKGKLKPINIYQVMGWDPEAYLQMRGKENVEETLRVCWADHCPPEKIFGYQKYWGEQFERTEHLMCKELSDFFGSHMDISGELTRLTLQREIRDNGKNYLSLGARFQELTSQALSPIPNGQWAEKLHHWAKALEEHLETLAHNYKGNPEADKLHRDLLDVFEKVEALLDRLNLQLELPASLQAAWEAIRQYTNSEFQLDETDFTALYDSKYSEFQQAARGLVTSVAKRQTVYHEMMSLVGSMTEQQKRGCENYKKALELHWERKWDESIAMFQEVLKDIPADKAALSFIDRLEKYKDAPPPDDWQGQFAQTKK